MLKKIINNKKKKKNFNISKIVNELLIDPTRNKNLYTEQYRKKFFKIFALKNDLTYI